jgi:hypothetical protein
MHSGDAGSEIGCDSLGWLRAPLPSSAATRRVSMTPGKGGDDKDSPLHFSGEIKDWPTFKEAIR